jgi:uncharacterized membrane protein YdjX (TVP38/TMEM64 family)
MSQGALPPAGKGNETMVRNGTEKRRLKGFRRPALLVLFVIAVIVLARAMGIGDRIGGLRDWVESFGAFSSLVYVLIYIGAVVAAVPGVAITVVGAALFGSVTGVILVSIGSTVGASLSFLIARYIARDLVVRWLSGNDKFLKLDRMTEEQGALIVAITRLVPLFPFNVLNYGFGLTGVRFRTYVFWSWLCMLPGTVFYVVATDTFVSVLSQGKIPWILVGALVLSLILLSTLIRLARGRLRDGGRKTGADDDNEAGVSGKANGNAGDQR